MLLNRLSPLSIMRVRDGIFIGLAVLLGIVQVTNAQSIRALDNEGISHAVKTSLLHEDSVGAADIDVVANNNIVTLLGRVDSLYEKIRAKEVAEKVKGVISVINQIEVAQSSDRSAQIRADVLAALGRDPLTNPWTIQVEVTDGIVTLKGHVESRGERLLCERIASRVRGVRSVNNRIEYSPRPSRADKDIELEIEERLSSDNSISSPLVEVSVLNGEVNLKGSVGSAADRRTTIAVAWNVSGVTSVDARSLRVRWWLGKEDINRRSKPSDEEIKRAILREFRGEPYLTHPDDISVDVRAGNVTLSGHVTDLPAKRVAAKLAQQTVGVWSVRSHIQVDPIIQPSDEDIAEVIRYALRHDPYVDRFDITVRVEDGHGVLTGVVDSWSMKRQAEEVAAHIQGLVSLENDLAIDKQIPRKSDTELEESIGMMLEWTSAVSSEDVHVDVLEGVATLTGTVESWTQEQLAEELAMKAGATSVINKIEAAPGSALAGKPESAAER